MVRVPFGSVLRSNALAVVGDVATVSLSSLALTWVAGQTLSATEFGMFGIVFVIVTLVQSFFQGGLGDVILRTRGERGGLLMRRLEMLSPLSVAVGSAGLLLDVFAGQQILGSVMLALGIGWFFARLALCRSVFAVLGQTWRSMVMNLALFGGTIASVLVVVSGWGSFETAMACVLVGFSIGWLMSARSIRIWVRTQPGLPAVGTTRLGLEAALVGGGAQLANVLVVLPLGLDFSAGMRISAMLLGPVNSLLTASRFILFPVFLQTAVVRLFSKAMAISLAFLILVSLWVGVAAVVLVTAPDLVAGDSASVAQSLFFWFGLGAVLQAFYWGLFLACKSHAMDGFITRARVLMLVIIFASVLVTMAFPSPEIFFIGSYASQVSAGIVLIVGLLIHARRSPSRARAE